MSMIKVIPPRSWAEFDGLDQLAEVKYASAGLRGTDFASFVKRASHPLALWVRDNPPKPGEVYVHSIALGSAEKYGCFFEGAPVQTVEGLRPIESIEIGDLVLTHKNRYRRVICTFRADYSGTRVAIKASGVPLPLVTTPEHPVWVVRRADFAAPARCEAYLLRKGSTKKGAVDAVVRDRALFVRADTVEKGDYLIVPTDPEPVGSTRIETHPYAMGVYLAEGCVGREYRAVPTRGKLRKVILTTSRVSKKAMVDRVRTLVGRSARPRPSRTSAEAVRVEIGHNAWAAEAARLFGTDGVKKRIPPEVFAQTREWKLEFISGYLDGDGCVTKTGASRGLGTVKPSTASLNLAVDLQRLLASVDVPCSVIRGWNRRRNGCFGRKDHVIYHVNIGSAYTPALLERCRRLTLSPDTPSRKKQGAGQLGTRYMLVPVTRVSSDVAVGTTRYNVEVEEDNSYVVFGAVHNCNRNADLYGEAMLSADHPTFEKCARWYLNHQNRDPQKSYGVVRKAVFNEPLGRVEVVTALNGDKSAADRNGGLVAERTLNKLASGVDVAVSQSCQVPGDYCNGCGHYARNRGEYCTGMTCKYGGCRDNLGRVFDDGHHLAVDNRKCRFFDLSDVSDTRGADRTAFITGKVAAADRVAGGAELAEMMNLVPPEHLVDPTVRGGVGLLKKLAGRSATHVPPWETVLAVRSKLAGVRAEPLTFSGSDAERHHAVTELARAGVVLPPDIWLSAVTGAPAEKCAACFVGGVDPVRDLLNRDDCYDLISDYTIAGSVARPHWLAPSARAVGLEAQAVELGATKSAAQTSCPPAVAAEARARYCAYQAGVLLANEKNDKFHLILSDAIRHNS